MGYLWCWEQVSLIKSPPNSCSQSPLAPSPIFSSVGGSLCVFGPPLSAVSLPFFQVARRQHGAVPLG